MFEIGIRCEIMLHFYSALFYHVQIFFIVISEVYHLSFITTAHIHASNVILEHVETVSFSLPVYHSYSNKWQRIQECL